jgi:uncharacterized protein DUF1549
MKRISPLLLAALLAAPACSSSNTGDDQNMNGSGSGSDMTSNDQWDQLLGQRVVDYSAALRVASLRLTGDLPTMDDINAVANAADDAAKKTAYEGLIDKYMASPAFAKQMFYFWRDTFRQGEAADLDTAPAFAAMLSVNDGAYTDLFTAANGNCPTFDEGTGVFTAADCANGGPQAGVLANPGVMKQFFSNFAFRRVRWVQETFVCTKFPAEVATTPTNVGGSSPYTGVWPFASISTTTAKGGMGRVDFQDTSAVICANCHSTINHIAPLFAYYDMNGVHQSAISVPTPLDGAPPAQMTDYLPPTETTAWRMGQPVADMTALGAAMAQDPDVAACGVARIWDWALGKTDIVDTLEIVPAETIQSQIDAFKGNGFKLKSLIRAVYTSDDFVKF